MKEDDAIRMQHMLDAAREAVSFLEGRARADFDSDRKLVLALVKSVEIIGEAAYRVSEMGKNQIPLIPWSEICGMRHRLIHAYYNINLDILWNTIHGDLPLLIAVLERAKEDGKW